MLGDGRLGKRRAGTLGAVVAVLALTVFVATRPVTTRQGINFEVSTHKIPLYLKTLEFVDRSAQYQQLADEITRGAASDAERALKVFDWTRRRIKKTPEGWPIVDDHILNIIIRGHGVGDQEADVFATLTTYAGVPAFWSKVPLDRRRPGVILSFARIDGRWRVFDVANGVVFRTGAARLATLEDLAGHPELVPDASRSISVEGVSYGEIVTHASMPPIPHPLRAELQMPWPRVWHEMKATVGLEPTDESE